MNKSKNIGFDNLDNNLQNKIENLVNYYNGAVSGASPSAWQTLIGDVNTSINNLKSNKIDVSELPHLFNKNNDKVTKQMLDAELSSIATSLEKNKYRGINDKITYSDLAKDTTDRIERTEDRLEYINNYLLTNGAGSGNNQGVNDKLFNDSIQAINKKIDDNKTDADNKISGNANDIADLQKKTNDLKDIADGLDDKYQKKDQPINYNDLPVKAQETLNRLSNSLPFSQDDKDLLNSLSSDNSVDLVIGNYVADDIDMLNIYIDNEFDIIYYIVTGASSQNQYTVKYENVGINGDGHGTVTNAAYVFKTEDSNTTFPLYSEYKCTMLSESESTKFRSSLIYSNDSQKLYFNDVLLSQRPMRLIDKDITITKNTSEILYTDKVLSSAINTNVYINVNDTNGNVLDGSHLVSLVRYEDKIELINEADEDITINIVIKDYMV